ncbi:MAG TPA: tRNA (N6-isopentenyl adenosine(37)-C2)-methylthiotransferase MiaB [Desulfurivibrionaceae bacterium]|nr:tRNA (N6-isopentenyl adenosine(37)-C2)-methylthiotransferase MiaB [Desulfurivibrionaceae bacterium]
MLRPASNRLLHIETFGCQMNERDSEIMAQLMAAEGYLETAAPEEADLIVVNTCSIRGKAEQKAMSLLGRYRKLKKRKPSLVVAVTGCVAQQEGAGLLERMGHLDLVVGPQEIYRLPELVANIRAGAGQCCATSQSPAFAIPPFLPEMGRGPSYKRFVTIMQGCNNFCTYCVVPYTRGREISREPADILAEVSHLAALGVREVTLLGQNVNSYGKDREGLPSFAALLHQVAALPGISRLRFTTSHPKDLSEELMRCFAEIPALCPHFHLPVQSGSDAVLQRMNRKYTREAYLAKVEKLRAIRPDIALTTDIIVGFPGESEADFLATMELLELVRYHGAFSFKYSDRPHAASAQFTDKVPEAVKGERLAILQARQEEITLARKQELVGSVAEVMVEGDSRNGNQWSGRTAANFIVNFSSTEALAPGQLVLVRLDEACQNSFRGTIIQHEEQPA